MVDWSNVWKTSKSIRKQRKYRFNAPLHIRKKFVSAHLSKELREKHKKRSMAIVSGDKVILKRGQFKGQTGKVERVDLKYSKIFVTGVEVQKKDGNKVPYPVEPSNVVITDLNLEDKARNSILERKK